MKKIVYYLRLILFTIYLICIFLLIEKILSIKIFGPIYLIFSLIYSIFMIISVLSKKEIYINTNSFNLLNIGIYVYYFIVFYFGYTTSRLEVINTSLYYIHNFSILCILLGFQVIYTVYLNLEEK